MLQAVESGAVQMALHKLQQAQQDAEASSDEDIYFSDGAPST